MGQVLVPGRPRVAQLGGAALPLAGRARVYACGITPYDVTHLGHAATFVWVDTLARVLGADGTEVIVCRNVTDVDDVLLAAAGRAGAPYGRFAAIQQFYFDQDMAALKDGHGIEESKLFLTQMIRHHQGAIAMAQDEITSGQSQPAIALAHSTATTQQQEIDHMLAMLATL